MTTWLGSLSATWMQTVPGGAGVMSDRGRTGIGIRVHDRSGVPHGNGHGIERVPPVLE
jgi:hypothetical protein